MKLFINGEARIELKESLDQLERHSLPDFKAEALSHKQTGAPIKKYLRGSLRIPVDLDLPSANKAIEACPTGALGLAGTRLVVNEQKCLFCDACARATTDKIKVHRTFLLVDFKNGVSPIVKRVIDRMMDEQAAARIIKGVDGYKARDKTRLLIDNTGKR
ncbi:MAG: hypothetical protein Q6353_001720 [Candidatus Sigynarchaeum springense]